MADLIGQKLGQYEIISLLGEGGMASVYRARQESVDRFVALKVIRPNLGSSSNFIERFKREAKTIASLSHPHILKVFDYGQHEDIVYLVMEQLTGGSLSDLIPKGPMSVEATTRLLEQIAGALDYAHRRGIVHRDLKPQNVLLDEDQNAFLTDFGIARLMDSSTGFTQTGAVIGTPSYMSPEQWKGGAVDSRADIYSLGVMMYEMLSGQLPFVADTTVSMMHKHIYELPPLVHDRRPELSSWVDEVILTAMAKEPSDRFGSGAAMVAAFKDALQNKGPEGGFVTVTTNPPPAPTGEMRRPPLSGQIETPAVAPAGNRNILIGVGVGVIALLLIGAFVLFQMNATNNANATATAIAMLNATGTSVSNANATATQVINASNTAVANVTQTAIIEQTGVAGAAIKATNTAEANATSTAVANATSTVNAIATNTAAALAEAMTATARVTPTVAPTIAPSTAPTTAQPATVPTTASTSEANTGPQQVAGKSRIAFLSKSGGAVQIFTAKPDGTDVQQLTSSTDFKLPPLSWSDKGSQIAFTIRSNISQSIYVMDADGGNVARFAGGSFPQWSPNGIGIAFIGSQKGKEFLYIMDKDGNNQRPLTTIPVRSFAWSPDSRYIAFIAGGLWIIEPNSKNAPLRLNNDTTVSTLSWSPDSTQVVVTSGTQLYIVDAVSGGARHDLVAGANAVWSPDGDHIMYMTNPSVGTIIIVKTDGSDSKQIGSGSDPRWSLDGKHIAYAGTDGKIYVVDADGSNQKLIGEGTDPTWSP